MQQCNNQKLVVVMESEKKEEENNERKEVTDGSSLSQLLGWQDMWSEGAMLTWPRLMHLAIRNSCDFSVLP